MNIYIHTWQSIMNAILTLKESMLNEYTIPKKSNDIRELASKQLSIMDEMRQDKNKSLYSQASEDQKEFIDYIEKVIVYGNLEGKDNVNIRNSTI